MLTPASPPPRGCLALPGAPARIGALVVGVSSGAMAALGALLPRLPAMTPWPIVVVVHVPANQPSLLPSLFSRTCALPAREAYDKLPITPGIWFAPPDYHLLVAAGEAFALSVDEAVNHSRPSIDVLFESAADVYGDETVALVLTGASSDGAAGAKAIRDAGGFVIAQDPSTAEVATMPAATIDRARPQWVAPLTEIAAALRDAALTSQP